MDDLVNTRLAIGIHILSIVALSNEPERLNSEWIAGSIQTNPVVVRRMTSALKKAGLVKAVSGNRGLKLTKSPETITFLDILRAVDPQNELFAVHQNTNLDCVVGRNIESTLAGMFGDVQQNTENCLVAQNLQQVINQLHD